MDKTSKLLADIVTYRTYASYLPHLNRRECIEEIINRSMSMHLDRFGSLSKSLSKDIIKTFGYVHDLKNMGSMRMMQFAGDAILRNNIRGYNCSASPIDNVRCFGEALFILLSGCGYGYSVQTRHTKQLPKIDKPSEEGAYIVHDSIQGWAQAVDALMEAYFFKRIRPVFNFNDIRPKGSILSSTGAKAPGPEPLKKALILVEEILKGAIGRQLNSFEIHCIICILADCVLAGGIRRAACIALFDRDDELMLKCKVGEWWIKHPYLARANNSAVLPRNISFEEFKSIFDVTRNSGSGEPGFSWSDDFNLLFNPCFTGDTLLQTSTGYKTFKELSGRNDLKLYNYKNEIVNGRVWSNGVKKIVKLTLSTNETIRCTPEHRFMLNDTTERQAKDLKGLRLMPNYKLFDSIDEEFVKLGYIQGDAVLSRLNSDTHRGLEIHIGNKDQDVAKLFNIKLEDGKSAYYTRGFNDLCTTLEFSSNPLPTREFPKSYNTWGQKLKASFLKGLYSANGSIISAGRVSFKTTCKELSLQLQKTLVEDFNIQSVYITTNKTKNNTFKNGTYLCKESYDVNIAKFQDIVKFANQIAFIHTYKNDALEEIILKKAPLVKSIKDDGEEEVFDFELKDDTHWGIIASDFGSCGYVAHNCHEITLTNQFCNLVTGNLAAAKNKKDFLKMCHGMALLGTLQAAYTDFPYLRPIWKENTERDALMAASLTGIADAPHVQVDWLKDGVKLINELNVKYARKIGINPSIRTTAIKPEGSSSCVMGSSSGNTDRHDEYYLRRVEMQKDDSLYKYLQTVMPELCEDSLSSPLTGIVGVPIKSPEGSITRDKSSALKVLKRAMKFNRNWIAPGHHSGANKNNVSSTIYVKENEWDEVCEFMYENRGLYSGIALLPYDGGTYKQAPFETITKDQYDDMVKKIGNVDLKEIREDADYTNRGETVACAGGVCDIL